MVHRRIDNTMIKGSFMVFNATFYDISVISWRSVLLVEETGVSGENHRPSGISLKTIIYYINIMLICQISRKSLTIPMGIIRSRKSKDILYNSKKKKRRGGQIVVFNTLHRKLKIEQHQTLFFVYIIKNIYKLS